MGAGVGRPLPAGTFTTFGELLRYLRRRARLTQRELGAAVGYTHSHVCRLENDVRRPDQATVSALFVPALGLDPTTDAELIGRLRELVASSRDQRRAGSDPDDVGARALLSVLAAAPPLARVHPWTARRRFVRRPHRDH